MSHIPNAIDKLTLRSPAGALIKGISKKMNTPVKVVVMGGLGNQIFQFAAAYAIAQDRNTTIILDTTYYFSIAPTGLERPFELNRFVLPSNTIIRTYSLVGLRLFEKLVRYLPTRFFKSIGVLAPKDPFGKPQPTVTPRVLYGYFQHQSYFLNVQDRLREIFSTVPLVSDAAQALIQDIASQTHSVSLHVRRGDYVANQSCNQLHGTSPAQYYEQAVAKIQSTYSDKRITFYIFSDDIAWCKENLKYIPNTVFVSPENMDSPETLVAMTKCHHFIIANSTFSWWAAWIGMRPSSMVIMPKKWTRKLFTAESGLYIQNAIVI